MSRPSETVEIVVALFASKLQAARENGARSFDLASDYVRAVALALGAAYGEAKAGNSVTGDISSVIQLLDKIAGWIEADQQASGAKTPDSVLMLESGDRGYSNLIH